MTNLHFCTLRDLFTKHRYLFWLIEISSDVVNLIYWPWPQTCSWKFGFNCCLRTAKQHCLFEGHKIFGASQIWSSEGESMTTWWKWGGGNQAHDRKKDKHNSRFKIFLHRRIDKCTNFRVRVTSFACMLRTQL